MEHEVILVHSENRFGFYETAFSNRHICNFCSRKARFSAQAKELTQRSPVNLSYELYFYVFAIKKHKILPKL